MLINFILNLIFENCIFYITSIIKIIFMPIFLPFEVSGNLKSDTIIIFLHGWPDSCRLWDNTVSKF